MRFCLQRTEATIKAPNGSTFKVTKGAAHAVLGLVQTNKEVVASGVNKKVNAPVLYGWLPACSIYTISAMSLAVARYIAFPAAFGLTPRDWSQCLTHRCAFIVSSVWRRHH